MLTEKTEKNISQVEVLSLSEDTPEEILKIILYIFSNIIKKMNSQIFRFSDIKITIRKTRINFIKQTKQTRNVSFETKQLYDFLLNKIIGFLPSITCISFNSIYSALYFRRIIKYLSDLMNLNTDTADIADIANDKTVKLFFYLFFLYIEEYFNNKYLKFPKKKLFLDEAFYKGTFIELTRKYSKIAIYKDSDEINNIIRKIKNKAEGDVRDFIDSSFQEINYYLQKYGNKTDIKIKDMIEDSNNILSDVSEANLKNVVKKIKKFYSNKEFATFINYISVTDIEELKPDSIDTIFLNGKESQYLNLEFNYNGTSKVNVHKKNFEEYLDYFDKKYKRNPLYFLQDIINWNLEDEEICFAIVENNIYFFNSLNFKNIEIFKRGIANLEQEKILRFIQDIINDNDFIEFFFSILNNDIIKKYFNSYLKLEEKDKECEICKRGGDSKSYENLNFKNIYNEFLKEYNNKKEAHKKFKDLIILKILAYGDREYTIYPLKIICINPAQFALGVDIVNDDNEIKIILKGYLLIVLLYETANLLRSFNKKEDKGYEHSPIGREGGELFINYIFGVKSINHINKAQAQNLMNSDYWKDHENIKKIFQEELEDVMENNIDDFLLNYFSNSISFYSSENKLEQKSTIIKK